MPRARQPRRSHNPWLLLSSMLTVSLLVALSLSLGLASLGAAQVASGRTYWLDPAHGKCTPSWAGLARRWFEQAAGPAEQTTVIDENGHLGQTATEHHLERRYSKCISTICTKKTTQTRAKGRYTTHTVVKTLTKTSVVSRLRTSTVTQALADLTGTKVVLATANLANHGFYELRTTSTVFLPNPTATAVATITANAGLPPHKKTIIVTYTSVRLLTKEVRFQHKTDSF